MQQATNVKDIFEKYFSVAITPNRIIELGTGVGEFTHMIYDFRKSINDDFDFITIDQRKEIEDIPWPMIFCQMNIFAHIDFIGSMIKENTLVLCDNGNKIEEVKRLTPYLKKDCVIMAHDYFYCKEDVGGYWGCCEITWDDVKDLGLVKYQHDLMKQAAWLSLKTK